uniref:Uncharacterized protein n=1 Tax=Arundo donax TaxID=35708 RepID=A0A0A8YSF1_ARUDO
MSLFLSSCSPFLVASLITLTFSRDHCLSCRIWRGAEPFVRW